MNPSWEIRRLTIDDRTGAFLDVLAKRDRPSFIDDCLRKDRDRAARIITTAVRVHRYGLDWAYCSGTIKRIRGGEPRVAVFETRVKGSVIRIATYIDKSQHPVFLFDFDTHAGGGNKLPEHDKERAFELAAIAEQCAKDFY